MTFGHALRAIGEFASKPHICYYWCVCKALNKDPMSMLKKACFMIIISNFNMNVKHRIKI